MFKNWFIEVRIQTKKWPGYAWSRLPYAYRTKEKAQEDVSNKVTGAREYRIVKKV